MAATPAARKQALGRIARCWDRLKGACRAASSRTWCTRRTQVLTGSRVSASVSSTRRCSPYSGETRCGWYPSASRTTCRAPAPFHEHCAFCQYVMRCSRRCQVARTNCLVLTLWTLRAARSSLSTVQRSLSQLRQPESLSPPTLQPHATTRLSTARVRLCL